MVIVNNYAKEDREILWMNTLMLVSDGAGCDGGIGDGGGNDGW